MHHVRSNTKRHVTGLWHGAFCFIWNKTNAATVLFHMKQTDIVTVTLPWLSLYCTVPCTHHVSVQYTSHCCCMYRDHNTAYWTVLLRNTCLTCHVTCGYTALCCYVTRVIQWMGWHGVYILYSPCYVTHNGHALLARVLRRPAPVHGQGRSNKTLGVRVGCRLRARSDEHTSDFHLHTPIWHFPTLHLHTYAFHATSTILSLLISQSDRPHPLPHSELFSKNTWHPLKMRV